MNPTVVGQPGNVASVTSPALTTARVAAAPLDEVLRWLAARLRVCQSAEASARLIRYGPNAVRTHRVSAIAVLGSQLRNAVLILLAATAVVSFFLGDSTQAIIIGAILAASIGLGLSTSIAPNAPPLHCIPASTILPWCVATGSSARSTSPSWFPAT